LALLTFSYPSDIQVARRLDNLQTRQRETDRQSDSSETLHLEEGEDHPLKNVEK
jgi:hypothetical protein